ncbi:MAG: hypothetical protein AB7V27_11600 [Candidatus Binatia bacterium]
MESGYYASLITGIVLFAVGASRIRESWGTAGAKATVPQGANNVTGREGGGGGWRDLVEQYLELPATQRDATSAEFNQIVEGIDTVNNPQLQSEIGTGLTSGRVKVFENVVGRSYGLTASDGTVYLSDNFFTLDAGTRGIVLSHETFHVYEGLFFGLSVRGNEFLADVFATNVYRSGLSVGNPRAHFVDLCAGRVGALGRQTPINLR